QRPIKPGIVKIRTTLKTNIAKVFLANSITLTPGTMTCEIDDDYLYIHWIWVQSSEIEEASKIIAKDFEKFLRRIFE
ncbi:MAG: Na+/H+ antiporter subunit E, partial [bacterium]